MRRIRQSDLVLNEPLPWPLYDENGNLLLREGYVLSIPRHIDSLLARGAYAPDPPADNPGQPVPTLPDYVVPPPAADPVFARADTLALTLKRLHAHLLAASLQAELRQVVLALARGIIDACSEDADALLATMGVTDPLWLELVRQHHERTDGSGYPRALSGDAILPGARLLAIADSYAAMVTPRPNRVGQFPRDALKSLFLERARLYDDPLVQLSIKTLTMHPPGTLARLANGEFAVVRSRQKQNEPMDLWSLYDSSGMPILRPQRRDSTDPAHGITGSLRVEECRSAALVLKRLWMKS